MYDTGKSMGCRLPRWPLYYQTRKDVVCVDGSGLVRRSQMLSTFESTERRQSPVEYT